jgi:hypothetical protein
MAKSGPDGLRSSEEHILRIRFTDL